MPFDPTKMTADELRKLKDSCTGLCKIADVMADITDHAPVFDLTGPTLIRVPLLAAAVSPEWVLGVDLAEGPSWSVSQDRPPAFDTEPATELPVEPEVASLEPAPAPTAKPFAPMVPPPPLNIWTEEEEAAVLDGVRANPTAVNAVIAKEVAKKIDRTAGAIGFRMARALEGKVLEIRKAHSEHIAQQQASKAPEPVSRPQPAQPAEPAAKQPENSPTPLGHITYPAHAPIWHRDLNAWLNAFGYKDPWTPGLDLDLVQSLARGSKLNVIAADFGIDIEQCKIRFNNLRKAATEDGHFGIDQQTRLITVLKARAREAESSVAAQ